MTEKTPVWVPPRDRVERSNMWGFLLDAKAASENVTDYASLHEWSVRAPDRFWSRLWDFTAIRASRRWVEVVDDPSRMPGAKWFSGARLNFAENLLGTPSEEPAIVGRNENGPYLIWSRAQLHRQVAGIAAGLEAEGIRAGDRVAGYLPNIPHTVAAMLGAAAIGATWSSCSPDFGVRAVRDRFGQIEPKVLFAAPSYQYSGRTIDCRERLLELKQKLPSVQQVVLAPYLDGDHAIEKSGFLTWNDFLQERSCSFKQLPFDHPLYILYSSGTTGLPKCIVHGAGGTLLQHLKEVVLHTDVHPGDRIFYYTTCGWMMWNWLVSALAAQATIVLYDGSPFHPSPDVLLDLAEEERLAVFGTSAKYLSVAQERGVGSAGRDLGDLRTILSTGSPLAPENYDYVYSDLKQDVCLSSISGGTDIVSCFALGSPTEPVYRGELQVRGLGMDVDVFDELGQSVSGSPGELVCKQAFPSMPIGFWKDPEQIKYRAAYFNDFPGIWRHGDWAELTERGGLIIHGRSDATLNPGGVRIGTAEIYRQVEALAEVSEALVVGQEWQSDTRIVLFVRLAGGTALSADLEERIRTRIRQNTSPHHVPKKILPVEDIPRTISGKISELAVRNVIHGLRVTNVQALANPESLDLFRDLEALRT